MKGIVVYYSGTGNTAKIARAIHKGMKDAMEVCDITSLKEANPKDLVDYDVIGIGAPIWYFREPANVRIFIINMPQLDGKLCFPFCVHGSAPAGFMFSIVPPLQGKGLTIIGYNDWYGSVDQVLHAPKPYFTDGHPDEIDLQEAEEFGREMATRAGRIASGENHLIPTLPKGAGAGPLWRPNPFKHQPRSSSETGNGPPVAPRAEWKINTEKCTYPECTLCADNCLVSCIDLSATPPLFKKSCIGDGLCERICPEGAIEPDEASLRRRPHKIINMERCDYPECTLCVNHCPMDAIDFSITPPVFKWNCEADDLCIVICPKGAIEMPNVEKTHGAMVPKAGQHHPFLKLLEEAEAEGRFRRLVPLDQVGWDNPVYKIGKRPIFDIEED
jgi:flavodoxin/formate hydrogenlyase subunit 6/NADH:ubiquinone oxidoreductase subunit I